MKEEIKVDMPLVKIAVCDDESTILNTILKRLDDVSKKIGFQIITEGFESGTKLIDKIINNDDYYDIYFLDIEMDGLDGIKCAQKIREVHEEAIIVFLTNYDTWMFDAFDVHAFNYILKSNIDEKFEKVLMKCFEYIKGKKTLFYFKTGKKLISIQYKNILYFESNKRKIKVHTIDNEYWYYDVLNNVEIRVRDDIFIRTHASYLINMEHVNYFDGKSVILDDDSVIPVSQKHIYSFNVGYMEFLKRKC